MLSTDLPSQRQRTLAAALIAVVVLVGFAPVRLTAFEAHGSDYETEGTLKVDGEPTRFAYLLKLAGREGTRGNIHIPADLPAARDLNRIDKTAVYFRFGDERWITNDAPTIAEVRRALVVQDRFEERRAPADKRLDDLERHHDRIEARYEELQTRKDELEDRKAKLQDKWQERKDAGKSTAGIALELERLEEKRAELETRSDELYRAREALAGQRKLLHAADKRSMAEHDRIERETDREIERIARRAITRGVARSYETIDQRSGGRRSGS